MIRMVMADGNGERLCGSCQKKKKSEVGGGSDAGRKVRRDPRSGVMCLHSGQWHSCYLLWHPVPSGILCSMLFYGISMFLITDLYTYYLYVLTADHIPFPTPTVNGV